MAEICSACLDVKLELLLTYCPDCKVCPECQSDGVAYHGVCAHSIPYKIDLHETIRDQAIVIYFEVKQTFTIMKALEHNLIDAIDELNSHLKVQVQKLADDPAYTMTRCQQLTIELTRLQHAVIKNLNLILDHNNIGITMLKTAITRGQVLLEPDTDMDVIRAWLKLYQGFSFNFITDYMADAYTVHKFWEVKPTETDMGTVVKVYNDKTKNGLLIDDEWTKQYDRGRFHGRQQLLHGKLVIDKYFEYGVEVKSVSTKQLKAGQYEITTVINNHVV